MKNQSNALSPAIFAQGNYVRTVCERFSNRQRFGLITEVRDNEVRIAWLETIDKLQAGSDANLQTTAADFTMSKLRQLIHDQEGIFYKTSGTVILVNGMETACLVPWAFVN